MTPPIPSFARAGALLAVNLTFLMLWGFAGISKVIDGMPPWFAGKFGPTILGRFPGLTATFWLFTVSELLALALAAAALLRIEFLGQRRPLWLSATLAWSLFVFLQLGFGQWLTGEFTGGLQMFTCSGVTLVALQFVGGGIPSDRRP